VANDGSGPIEHRDDEGHATPAGARIRRPLVVAAEAAKAGDPLGGSGRRDSASIPPATGEPLAGPGAEVGMTRVNKRIKWNDDRCKVQNTPL
jgi:hypothetical protein